MCGSLSGRIFHVRPELRLLERHTHRSGRDTVDHGRIGSDDFANSCCGVLRNLSNYLEHEDTYAAFQD